MGGGQGSWILSCCHQQPDTDSTTSLITINGEPEGLKEKMDEVSHEVSQEAKGTQTLDPEPAVEADGQESLLSPPSQTQMEPSSQATPARKRPVYIEAAAQTSYVKIPPGNKWRAFRLCTEAQVQTSCPHLPLPRNQTALRQDVELA